MLVAELGKESVQYGFLHEPGKKGFASGFRHSPEARAKISAHMIAYWTPERRQAMMGNRRALSDRVIGICVYCGAPATCTDHVFPKSRGGDDRKVNRVLACRPCNQSKRDYTAEEWYGHMERVLRHQGRWPSAV